MAARPRQMASKAHPKATKPYKRGPNPTLAADLPPPPPSANEGDTPPNQPPYWDENECCHHDHLRTEANTELVWKWGYALAPKLYCRDCKSAANRVHYLRHAEKYRDRRAAKRLLDPGLREADRKRAKKWRVENPEKNAKAREKRYYEVEAGRETLRREKRWAEDKEGADRLGLTVPQYRYYRQEPKREQRRVVMEAIDIMRKEALRGAKEDLEAEKKNSRLGRLFRKGG